MTLIVRVILKSAVTYIHILTSVSALDRLFIHSYIIFNHMVRELRFFLNVVKAILTQGEHICKRRNKWPFAGYCPVYNIMLGVCGYFRPFFTKRIFFLFLKQRDGIDIVELSNWKRDELFSIDTLNCKALSCIYSTVGCPRPHRCSWFTRQCWKTGWFSNSWLRL